MKIDFKKELDAYRARHREFRTIDVPPLQYLMVDGHGDPNTAKEYADALSALYPVAYSLKFASKQELGRDYVVMPLEALWWASDMAFFTSARDKSQWDWTAMIMVPARAARVAPAPCVPEATGTGRKPGLTPSVEAPWRNAPGTSCVAPQPRRWSAMTARRY